MATLHCYLERGFGGEEVQVRLDGRVVFQDRATTDLMMGFAAEITEPLAAEGDNVLDIRLPESGLSERATLPGGQGDLWVRIRLEGGCLLALVGTEPLGFL
ncbi:MAG: hypothetical protein EA350_06830 [Gemmatimonadales bacterium]|nr:MAG: hypothetical protein EA350_06830 [Gemmatimonadales bacterium]